MKGNFRLLIIVILRVEYFRKALEYDPIESELLPPEEAVIDMACFREACFQGKQGPYVSDHHSRQYIYPIRIL